MHPFSPSLILFYIDNYSYIVVKTFSNNNFMIWKECSLQFWRKFRKSTIQRILPPVLSEWLTVLKLWLISVLLYLLTYLFTYLIYLLTH